MFGLGRRELIVFAIVLTAIIFGTGYRLANMKSVLDEDTSFIVNEKGGQADRPAAGDKSAGDNSDGQGGSGEEITVHVTGAVKKPGVFNLPLESRVIDAINLAQPAADADLEQLNLAAEIEDGEQIPVPHKGERADESGSGGSSAGAGKSRAGAAASRGGGKTAAAAAVKISAGKININRAGVDELDTLPGIGPALARRIVDYRENQGKFKDISELKNVSGIGDKKYEDLANLVTVK